MMETAYMFKHLKNFVKIFVCFLAALVVDLLAYIVVPIALLGLKPEDKHLPKWARWWETYDNDIDGDIYWRGEEHADGQQSTYWWRLRWLLRNTGGIFQHEVLGIHLSNKVRYVIHGDQYIADRPHGKSGWLYAEAWDGNKMYPCYLIVHQWGNTNRCLIGYFGWRFKHSRPLADWDYSDHQVQFVVTFNPLMGFRP